MSCSNLNFICNCKADCSPTRRWQKLAPGHQARQKQSLWRNQHHWSHINGACWTSYCFIQIYRRLLSINYCQQISHWIYSISGNRNLKSKYFGAIAGLPQTVCKQLSYYKGQTTIAENHSHLLPQAGWLSYIILNGIYLPYVLTHAICSNYSESNIQKPAFLSKAKRRRIQKTMQTFSWTCNIKQKFILDKFSQFCFLVMERSGPLPCLQPGQL